MRLTYLLLVRTQTLPSSTSMIECIKMRSWPPCLATILRHLDPLDEENPRQLLIVS